MMPEERVLLYTYVVVVVLAEKGVLACILTLINVYLYASNFNQEAFLVHVRTYVGASSEQPSSLWFQGGNCLQPCSLQMVCIYEL